MVNKYTRVGAILFIIGGLGVLINSKNLIIMLMSVELMLLAVSYLLLSLSWALDCIMGEIFAFMILTIAAAESAIGLAILVAFYRLKGSISVGSGNLLRG